MPRTPFEIEDQGGGQYLVRANSLEDRTTLTLVLSGASTATDGTLAEDEATASATMLYLLGRQDASDLPARVEIDDVLASYPDAADAIAAIRE
jgi:hypothetical protein